MYDWCWQMNQQKITSRKKYCENAYNRKILKQWFPSIAHRHISKQMNFNYNRPFHVQEQEVLHLQISSIYNNEQSYIFPPRKCQDLLTHAQFIHSSKNPMNTNLKANQQRPYSMVTNQHGEVTPLAQTEGSARSCNSNHAPWCTLV